MKNYVSSEYALGHYLLAKCLSNFKEQLHKDVLDVLDLTTETENEENAEVSNNVIEIKQREK